jgi:KDO2-lipid IV(A) lauroyltransferase
MTRWDALRFHFLRGGSSLLGRLGFGGMRVLGNVLGDLMWMAVPERRRLAVRNIAGRLRVPEEQAEALARRSFRHTGRSFAEVLLTDRFGLRSPRLRYAQPELWEALLSSPRPIVAATAHIGAWELLAPILGEMYPPPRPRVMVTRRYPDPAIHAFITLRREARGATMIGHRTVASEVLRALRRNGIAAFLVDHNPLRSEAISLPFLGEETLVNMGPALLAIRAEALLWPVFLIREAGNYVLRVSAPLDTLGLSGGREEKLRAAAGFYTKAVEDIIREYPEQWFWMHNRWKSCPF